jgi:hypothetical protein
MTQTVANAAWEGAGIDLDMHLPMTVPPAQRSEDDLNNRGAWIPTSDAEPKQCNT